MQHYIERQHCFTDEFEEDNYGWSTNRCMQLDHLSDTITDGKSQREYNMYIDS